MCYIWVEYLYFFHKLMSSNIKDEFCAEGSENATSRWYPSPLRDVNLPILTVSKSMSLFLQLTVEKWYLVKLFLNSIFIYKSENTHGLLISGQMLECCMPCTNASDTTCNIKGEIKTLT